MTSEALRLYPILHRLMLIGNITVPDPREALHEMDNSSKDGVGKVLVTREALINNGSYFLTDDDVTVCYSLGKPSINIGNPFG